jgi:hypothetical protein
MPNVLGALVAVDVNSTLHWVSYLTDFPVNPKGNKKD